MGSHVGNCFTQMIKGDLFIGNMKKDLNQTKDISDLSLTQEESKTADNWIKTFNMDPKVKESIKAIKWVE